jgi:hypothetical protein
MAGNGDATGLACGQARVDERWDCRLDPIFRALLADSRWNPCIESAVVSYSVDEEAGA